MFFPFLERRRAVAVSKKFKQSVNPRAFMVLYASYVLLGKSSVSDSSGTKLGIQAGIGLHLNRNLPRVAYRPAKVLM